MKTNQSLKSVKVYYENGVPFMEMVYTYDDKDGGHEVTFPKVEFPFPTGHLPNIIYDPAHPDVEFSSSTKGSPNTIHYLSPSMFISLSPSVKIFCKDGDYSSDKLVSPRASEMTLEEIEKLLGHPIKIVSERRK